MALNAKISREEESKEAQPQGAPSVPAMMPARTAPGFLVTSLAQVLQGGTFELKKKSK